MFQLKEYYKIKYSFQFIRLSLYMILLKITKNQNYITNNFLGICGHLYYNDYIEI